MTYRLIDSQRIKSLIETDQIEANLDDLLEFCSIADIFIYVETTKKESTDAPTLLKLVKKESILQQLVDASRLIVGELDEDALSLGLLNVDGKFGRISLSELLDYDFTPHDNMKLLTLNNLDANFGTGFKDDYLDNL